MRSVSTRDGGAVIAELAAAIEANKQQLSDLDGLTGDGDHGINMNKGFSICRQSLRGPGRALGGGAQDALLRVADTDRRRNGASLCSMFRAMAKECQGLECIDGDTFGRMLDAAEAAIRSVGQAETGDKTMLDALAPARAAFHREWESSRSFDKALLAMSAAAVQGRDSTSGMIAKVGRASRLGERSRGTLDAGASSCVVILTTLASSLRARLEPEDSAQPASLPDGSQ